MTFTLDTSGRVAGDIGGLAVWYEFDDLSPFAQGWVEAMFADMERQSGGQPVLRSKPTGKIGSGLARFVGFSDLAPEALALIQRDCAEIERGRGLTAKDGAGTWAARQRGVAPSFPPLTPYLGDDGKVHLREAS